MAPVKPSPSSATPPVPGTARFLVHTRSAGVAVSYDEYPSEWHLERYFRIVRRMRNGPAQTLQVDFTFAPGAAEGGTRLDVAIEVELRTEVARPLVWAASKSFLSKLSRTAQAIDAHLREGASDPFREAASPANRAALANAAAIRSSGSSRRGSSGWRATWARRATRNCPHTPLRARRAVEDDALDVLRVFPRRARRVGELRWNVVCPSCRTASREVTGLDAIGEEGHCQLCDVSFDLDLDRAVEATFVAHPAIREVPAQVYCIAGPARTPHVIAQTHVPAGAEAALQAPASPGRYRLFVRGGARLDVEVEPGGAPEVRVRMADDARRAPSPWRRRPRDAGERHREGRHVKIERLDYASRAATAHVVSTLPEFRRLFSRDLLKRERR